MRLSIDTLEGRAPGTTCFGYDRNAQAVGIVHFGIGAFHRAHQAWYTDRVMDNGDRNWAVSGVSLRSPAVAEQMNPQDGLYTVVEKSITGSKAHIVGAVRDVIVARTKAEALAARLASPETRILSFTVTEKGYCRAADGTLDMAVAEGDSIYPHLAAAFRTRRLSGAGGLTLLSCDNLSGNGEQLERLVVEYLDRHDPASRAWFEAECTCPSTMVDRIVPATTEADRADLSAMIGLEDQAAVFTEPFSQWVIEDRFAAGRPAWEKVGVELTQDVAPYEMAKLRLLNGAHSALAYLGLARGHRFVHEATADPAIRGTVEQLMRHEAAVTLPHTSQSIPAYIDALLARFANPALNHRLAQIAMDGSQKIPQRWLESLAWHQQHGSAQCPATLTALAAWLRHIRGDNGVVDDPMAGQLVKEWRIAREAGIVNALFNSDGPLTSSWHPTPEDVLFIAGAWSEDRSSLGIPPHVWHGGLVGE